MNKWRSVIFVSLVCAVGYTYPATLTVINKAVKKEHTDGRIFYPDHLHAVFLGEGGNGMEAASLHAGIKRILDQYPRMTVIIPEWAKSLQFRTITGHEKKAAASGDVISVDASRDIVYALTGPYVDPKRSELYIHAGETF